MIVDRLYTIEVWLQNDKDPQVNACLRLRLLEEDVGQVIDFVRSVRKHTVGDSWYQIDIEGPTKEYID